MVPEINDMTKQSTMKKLEIVVDKVRSTKSRIEHLRQLMERNPETGLPVPRQMAQHQYGGEMGHLSGWR